MIDTQKINTKKILSMRVSTRMEQQNLIRANEQIFISEFFGDDAEMDVQFSLYEMALQPDDIKIQLAESEFINMLEYTYDILGWVPNLTRQEDYEISSRKQTYKVFKNYAQYVLDSLAPIFSALETVDPHGEIKSSIIPIIRNYQDLFYEAERVAGYKVDLYERRCRFISGKIEYILSKMLSLIEEILDKVFGDSCREQLVLAT